MDMKALSGFTPLPLFGSLPMISTPKSFIPSPSNDSVDFSTHFGNVRFGLSFPSEFKMSTADPTNAKGDVVVYPVYEKDGKVFQLSGRLAELDRHIDGELTAEIERHGFKGQHGKVLEFPGNPNGFKAPKILVVGLGDQDTVRQIEIEKAFEKAFRKPGYNLNKGAAVVMPAKARLVSDQDMAAAVIGGTHRSTYALPPFAEGKDPMELSSVQMLTKNRVGNRYDNAIFDAAVIEQAVSLAKDIGDTPYNEMTGRVFVKKARDIARSSRNLKIHVEENVKTIEREYPSAFSVSKAAIKVDKPRFITMQYTPPGGKSKVKKRISLVLKTMLYDTGGASLKPSDGMKEMQKDKTGGAYGLALMQALGELKPEGVEVTAYFPVTVNLIGSRGQVPGSSTVSRNGQRIYVDNTDAEGRLTLIDGVTRAAEGDPFSSKKRTGGKVSYNGTDGTAVDYTKRRKGPKPDIIMTFATLTGAAAVAAGDDVAIMSPFDQNLPKAKQTASKTVSEIKAIADRLGEGFTPFEIRDRHNKAVKSNRTNFDITNRPAKPMLNGAEGHYHGAAFTALGLKGHEDKNIAFVHNDIAGPSFWDIGAGVKTYLKYFQQVAA